MAKISHCQGGLNQPVGLRMFKVGTKITKITKGFPQGMGKLKKIDLAMECYADGPNGSFYARNPFRQEFPCSLELTMEQANTGCRFPQFGHANRSGGRCFKEITGEMMSKV